MTAATDTMALIETLRPHLAGKPSQIQGAALADLLATWLAGHFVVDDREASDRIRRSLLAMHVAAVWRLIAVNDKHAGIGR